MLRLNISNQYAYTGLGVVGLVILCVLSLYSLSLGAVTIPLKSILNIYKPESMTLLQSIILWQIHWPRVLIAIISGALLAVSGLLMQAVTRNDLACPSLLGISQGVALTDIILLLFVPGISVVSYFLFSLLGGLVTAGVILLLALSRSFSQAKLILAGIAINTLFYAVSHLLILVFPEKAQSLVFNLNGSLMTVAQQDINILLLSVIFPASILLFLIPKFKVLNLSDLLQKNLGETPVILKSLFLIIAVWLNAAVVSVIGPVFLFGLVVPQALRLLGVYDLKARLFLSVIFGGLLMVFADSVIRYFYADNEIPIGIIIGLIAAPLFISLVRFKGKKE
ncbi:iron ABC transporter permease [Thiotrichales bacterium 19S9-12]|nr:iron ABC transporter permease [Thiotrichales bacterium 19S9-11]MCF6811774.1 iron ABC transporter permease [Thiotrichales bacterium 19S9-12]